MIEWMLVRDEVLPTILLMVGITLVFFCVVWLFLEYLMARTNSPATPLKDSKRKHWLCHKFQCKKSPK